VKKTNDLVVRPVRNGRGIVAAKSFRRGAILCEITGRIVTGETVWKYWETDPRLGENCFRYDDDHYIDPDGTIGAWANHSCNPNAGLVKRGRRLLLKAIAPIAAGTEVTHDYSTLLGGDDVWTLRCNCGEDNCRGRVRNIARLPAATLRRYRRLGIVPQFILDTR
jgi:SET domain-containing protein